MRPGTKSGRDRSQNLGGTRVRIREGQESEPGRDKDPTRGGKRTRPGREDSPQTGYGRGNSVLEG